MRNLNFRDYLTMPLPVPPPYEQAAIVRILEAVETALDRARAECEAAKALSTSLREDAVGGNLITAGMHSSVDRRWTHPRLGTIPPKWSVERLGKVCERVVDGTHQAVETSKSGVPFLYVSCVREGRIQWNKASFISEQTYMRIAKGREPRVGSVLYTAVGSYGNAALVSTSEPFSFQRHIAILYPNNAHLLGGYLALWLNSSRGKRWSEIHAVGNAQKTVTLTELSKMLIAFPRTQVQRELCDFVSGAEAVVDAANDRLNALGDIRRSLMHDLLTGRVRVTAPTGVPAS
jgi:type I restriction enzyme S subunit